MNNRKETAEKIITALTNRSGFNDLWYNLDEEIQTEITDDIVNILPIQIVSNRDSGLSDLVLHVGKGGVMQVFDQDNNAVLYEGTETECKDFISGFNGC